MEARAVVGVGSNYRDSGGKLPRAWSYGWRGHRSQGLPLTSCRSGMSLGTEVTGASLAGWLECPDRAIKAEGQSEQYKWRSPVHPTL